MCKLPPGVVKSIEEENIMEELNNNKVTAKTSNKEIASSSTSSSRKLSYEEKELEHKEGEEDVEHDQHDEEDMELFMGKEGSSETISPFVRRQKRRQRQRANAKIGKSIRRILGLNGPQGAVFQQMNLLQAQQNIVSYLDFIFGPMNLSQDPYLNTMFLDPTYKSAQIVSLLSFEAIQVALSPLGFLNEELQIAVLVDSLRYSQVLRCGPVCCPNGTVSYCFRVVVDTTPSSSTVVIPPTPSMMIINSQQQLPQTTICSFLGICGNCSAMIDIRFGGCGACGMCFSSS